MPDLTKALADALARSPRPRLTVARAGGLGDTLLILPALELVRRVCPDAELTFVGSAWAEEVLALMARPVRVVRFDSLGLAPLFAGQARQDPVGIFARADAVIIYTAGADDPLADNAERLCPGPVLRWPAHPDGTRHAAAHLAGAVMAAPPDAAELPLPELRPDARPRAWAAARLAGFEGANVRPAAVHAGSGGRRKCWPPEEFGRLIGRLDRPAVLIEGPADAEACQAIVALLPGGARVLRVPAESVAQAAAVLERCAFYVGNDSGLTHLAGMLGVPTVAVFGPTDPAVWAPLGRAVQVARGPGGTWPDVEDVLAALARLRPERL